MKIMRCPVCSTMLDQEAVRAQQPHWNPFKRRLIQCIYYGSRIKSRLWVFMAFWIWIASGLYVLFSDVSLPFGGFLLLLPIGVIWITMFLGISHQAVPGAEPD